MNSANAATGSVSNTFAIGGDLPVRRLGYGAMRLTGKGIWGPPERPEEAKKLLHRLLDLGINFIDTADAYGPEVNESMIAEALHPYPAGLVIATKGGHTRPGPGRWVPDGRPEYLKECVEKSLRRLRVERIDLYQLHRIDPRVPAEDSLGALEEMRAAGKIRHLGLSEVTVAEIERARKVCPIVSVQNEYNITNRKSEQALEYCEKEDLGFIPWFPIAAGDLAKPGGPLERIALSHGATIAQLALAWLLRRSPVMLPIPGTSSIAHLEENMGAQSVELTDTEWGELEAAAL